MTLVHLAQQATSSYACFPISQDFIIAFIFWLSYISSQGNDRFIKWYVDWESWKLLTIAKNGAIWEQWNLENLNIQRYMWVSKDEKCIKWMLGKTRCRKV
jgi:hypothetical protein